ncbi:MAG: insulinase family protein [Gemmataceae bacterium]|nr:insulinase family protein [Gemmataceae bacterium]
MSQQIYHHTFDNGLTLLAERMDHVRSAALNFLVPAGCVYDPDNEVGVASVLSEMITRGAGERDSRALSLALDNLGVDRDESVGQLHQRFWGATLASNIPAALEIYADILRRPHLPKDELEPVRALALQDLQALQDDYKSMVMVELRRRHWPLPLGRDRRGTPQTLKRITPASVRKHYERTFGPQGMIVSVAGNIDWPRLKDQIERLFGDWQAPASPALKLTKAVNGRGHVAKDTAQTQIAIAYPSVPFGHPDYYAAQGAVQVLSGGMGSRLFTEVREKRNLCYAVWASYQTFKDRACVLAYAGTTNERAQETLDVTVVELKRLAKGVTAEEVERVRAGLKSSVIMQEESTSARAGALASDWYYLGRVRPVEEVQAAIDGLTPEQIVSYVKKHPPRDMTVVTLGPTALK